ncbi:hypothetical protein SeMB42_g05507 [Synchytrium endobioticum]|uniref:Uncharacterized protein n=1 Tax=Synchytrium endobioticum TaxID=286115 RepID=A0A507CR25_9FUNG|nr:hypothetical protein SeMB42_g05507 [Synchytrium endobioticum]
MITRGRSQKSMNASTGSTDADLREDAKRQRLGATPIDNDKPQQEQSNVSDKDDEKASRKAQSDNNVPTTPTGDYVDWNVVDDSLNHSHDANFDTSLENEVTEVVAASVVQAAPEEFEDTLDGGIVRQEHDPEFQDDAGLDFGDAEFERRDDDEGPDYYENR